MGEIADYLLERQLAFKAVLGAVEQTSNDQANAIAKLIGMIEKLASPDNTDPCICKSIKFVCACVYVDVLPKIFKKRLAGVADARIDEYKKYLSSYAKVPILYKKGLDWDAVRGLAAQLVDPSV